MAPELAKRCNSDNEWTFGDGFQTPTTLSKPLQDRGHVRREARRLPPAKARIGLRSHPETQRWRKGDGSQTLCNGGCRDPRSSS